MSKATPCSIKHLDAESRKDLNDVAQAIMKTGASYDDAMVEAANDTIAELAANKQKIIDEVIAKFEEHNKPKEEVASLLDSHDTTDRRIIEGNITADEIRSEFESLVSNEEVIKKELAKLTKDGLIKKYIRGYIRPDAKKADLVDDAYESMLTDYHLNGETFSYSVDYMGRETSAQAITKKIRKELEALTDDEVQSYAEATKKRTEETIAKRKEQIEGLKDPKTLDDYSRNLRAKIDGGMTYDQARMSLTPEQRATFDEMAGEATRSARNSRADQQKTSVTATATTTSGEIFEVKHTKTGEDLFAVKASDRVDGDIWKQWLVTAKKLGGYYSRFSGAGAVPGFQFKTKENAEAFLQYLGGDVTQAKEAIQERRDAYADDKSQTAVERLTEMSGRLEDRSEELLNQDRKTNTSRRAGMAARAENAARADIALAKTMRNIANAIGKGKAKFLDRVRQKTQVELLQGFVHVAQGDKIRAKYDNYGDQQKHEGEKPDSETADFAKYPDYISYRSDLASLARGLVENEGTKKIGQELLKVTDDVDDAYVKFANENIDKVSSFRTKDGILPSFKSKKDAELSITGSGFKGQGIALKTKGKEHAIVLSPSEAMKRGIWKGDNDKRITLSKDFGKELVEKIGKAARRNKNLSVPWQLENAYDKQKRLSAMGIETKSEFRAALREFINLREAPKEADKIKEMERAMIRRVNDGLDFFPTPAGIADQMVETADIKEGMSVLEPSAGMGHIAERIRDAGVDPDVVELSNSRKELLEAKGFNVVGRDFIDITEKYDRIIMNPPFGDRRDAEHVQHAYDLLKPGGRLVAIMGEGVFFGSDKKAQAFRDWLEERGGTDEKLEEGTFKDPSLPVTTGVNARMVVIDKPDGELSSDAMFSRVSTQDIEIIDEFAKNDDIFRHRVSDKKTLKDIMEEVEPTFTYEESDTRGKVTRTIFKTEAGSEFYVFEKGDDVWIDVFNLRRGDRGNAVYAAVGNYAFNNTGKVFVGDPAGLTEAAVLRRTNHMLSLALKFGSIDFLGSSPEQERGDLFNGIEPLKWSGDYVEKVSELIHTITDTLNNKIPHLKGYRYDFDNQQFEDKLGRPLRRNWADALAMSSGARMARAGEGTLRRSVFLESLASSSRQEKSELLERIRDNGSLEYTRAGLGKIFSKTDKRTTGSTVSDIIAMLPKHVKALLDAGKLKVVQSVKDLPEHLQDAGNFLAHTVWHGSPHDHNKFDSSKIGTGEGAQAFGYGLYFTDKKDIAEYYRDALSNLKINNTLQDKLQEQGLSIAQGYAITSRVKSGGIDKTVNYLKSEKDNQFSTWDEKQLTAAIDVLKSWGQGKLYEVELAPELDLYLDWDKPLSEQSEKVKSALDRIQSSDLPKNQKEWLVLKQNGGDFYPRISKFLSVNSGEKISQKDADKAASDYLHSLGIRGIKYAAEGGKSDATNYVVFSDEDVSISAKYSKSPSNEISTPIQNTSSLLGGAANFPSNLSEIATGRKHINHFFDRVIPSASRSEQSSSSHGTIDSGSGYSKKLRNILTQDTFIKHGFSGINIPTRRMVLNVMRMAINDNKIGNSVIRSIPVDVMNFLGGQQFTPNMLFHDVSMLKDDSSINANSSIPVMINEAITKLILSHAGIGTEESSGFAFGDFRRGSFNGFTASGTIDNTHSVTPSSDVMLDKEGVGASSLSPIISKLSGVEALYDSKLDQIYLVADMLNKNNLSGVLGHEIFHRAKAQDPKVKAALERFEQYFQDSFNRAAKGIGSKIEREAYARVIAAKTKKSAQLEEYMAYQITAYQRNPESLPAILVKAIKDFIGAIRAALVRSGLDFGYVKSLTPADLAALSGYGAKVDKTLNPSNSTELENKAMASTKAMPETIKVNGKDRPTRNSNGQLIHSTEEGIRNFYDWFGDSKVVDDQGRPLVVYHGTNRDFNNFDIKKSGAANIDYGAAIYFTDSGNAASEYAALHDISSFANNRPTNGANVVAAYLRLENPFKADYEGSDEAQLPYDIGDAKEDGNDGLIIENVDDGGGSINQYIAFDSSQIKSATGNTGEFSPENADIRYSKNATTDDYKYIADKARTKINDVLTTNKSFNWWHKTVGTQFHKSFVDDDFKKVFDKSMQYEQDTAKFANEAADLAPDLLPKLEGLQDALGEVFNGFKRTKDSDKVSQAIFQTTIDDKRMTDEELVKAGYSQTQRDMYHQFFAAVNKSLDDLAKSEMYRAAMALKMPAADPNLSLKDTAQFYADNADDSTQAKEFLEKAEKITELKNQGYAPLMRFGKYTVDVIGKNPDGTEKREFFGMFESETEANEMRRIMEGEYPDAVIKQGIMSQSDWQMFKGITPETMTAFAKIMNVEQGDAFQSYLKMAINNRSAMKRLIHRKKMPGFASDPQRVLASFITSNAKAASKNIHLGEMVDAITNIPKDKGDVKDEAVDLYNYVQNPSEAGSQLRGALFTWYLGGSIASAAVNLTQTFTTTLPYLHQFGKTGQVASMMADAMKLAAGNTKDIGGELGKALKRAEEEGVTAPHELHMLYGESMRTGLMNSKTLRPLMKAWGSFFSLAEGYNRRVAFIAAYNLAVENREANPFEFASKAVDVTQFVYSKSSRPNWARSTVGSTVFTFKTFMINYLEFLSRLPRQEQLIALGVLIVFSGLGGLPGSDDADDIVDTLGQTLGYNTNAKAWKERALSNWIGKEATGYVLHGMSQGLPFDVSQRLSAGNIIPGSALFKRSETDKTRDVLEFVGPAGSLAQRVGDAVDAAQSRDGIGIKAATIGKTMLPKAFQDAIQGIDILQTGQYRDTKGRKVTDASLGDAVSKMIGFQPTSVAEPRRAERYLAQDVGFLKTVKGDINELWAQGIYEKNPDKIKEAKAILSDWNKKNPETPIKIKLQSILKRAKQMKMTSGQRLMKSTPKEIKGYANDMLAN